MREILRRIKHNRRQLFLLHFAGGSGYSFEFMMPFLTDFDVIALELPGRGKRIKENLTKDFENAASDFLNQILKSLKGPNFVLYGHSLGSLLAFRVCQLLEEHNFAPEYIVVSGNPGPGIPSNKKLHGLKQDAFIAELKTMGGIPDEIFGDSDSLNFFLPILRSDLELANYKDSKMETRINTPVYALMGDKEDCVDEISNWAKFTCADFRCSVLEGNHFFIYEQAKRVAEVINYFY